MAGSGEIPTASPVLSQRGEGIEEAGEGSDDLEALDVPVSLEGFLELLQLRLRSSDGTLVRCQVLVVNADAPSPLCRLETVDDVDQVADGLVESGNEVTRGGCK
jgi:hypothetical protein